MQFGLIGWYGHDNFGDERILYCIKNFFSDHSLFVTNGWWDALEKIDELNKCDYILIGGGGLILRNIDHPLRVIKKLKKPFSFLGVSIEAYHKDMEQLFEIMKQKAEFILVRDRQSKKYLNNHYKVIVGPDVTFLYPFNITKETERDICGLNLRDWYYWQASLYSRFHNIMAEINTRYPSIKKFYPFQKWEPDKVIKIIKRSFKEIVPIPLYFENDKKNDRNILLEFFGKVPSHFDINNYNEIRYLIGMRYHSIVFSVQCGIPFISLSYQPKNVVFCSEVGLSALSMDIFKLNELERKISFIRNNYDHIRSYLISYRDRCIKDINYIFQSLLCLFK